jgi:hypothetical protein
MLILVGDNPERIRSEAAFAKLCGACFTAVSRATFKCRIIAPELSADLGRACIRLAAKHGACCVLSVERIAFSVLMSELPST